MFVVILNHYRPVFCPISLLKSLRFENICKVDCSWEAHSMVSVVWDSPNPIIVLLTLTQRVLRDAVIITAHLNTQIDSPLAWEFIVLGFQHGIRKADIWSISWFDITPMGVWLCSCFPSPVAVDGVQFDSDQACGFGGTFSRTTK